MKVYKIIRTCTAAPILALAAIVHIYFFSPECFGGLAEMLILAGCLVVLPLLAYPMQPIFPKYRDRGREGQRTLAIIFAFAGYILALLFGLIFHVTQAAMLFILVYLFSGLMILFLNLVLHIHASGHACGAAGPLVIMGCIMQRFSAMGLLVMVLVWISSLKTQRHTWKELCIGMLIPVFSLCLTFCFI